MARLDGLPTEFIMLTPQVTYYRVLDENQLRADWLYFTFQAPSFQQTLLQYGRQSTRLYVGITAQRDLMIPFCSIDEQDRYIRKLCSMEQAVNESKLRHLKCAQLQKHILGSYLKE
ncbi:MAG: hypothetical protein ABIK32_08340 [Chloroflexota bacterium]